jgi:glycosyltransferase involved in cell wall biosynthesis
MLAILTTHPIQYQTPIWQALAKDGRVPFEVWYLTDFGTRPDLDVEFGKTFQWDIDTLSGYPYRLLKTGTGATPTNFWRCRLVERLRDRLTASGAKVIWIQGWQVAGYWQAVREACMAGVATWLRAESNDLGRAAWWKRPIKRAALGYLFSRVDRFFCIGSANRRFYRSFGVPESKLIDGSYAIDNARFARQANLIRGRRGELRREWGIDGDAFCVLFCGKFIEKKRPMDLIRAATIVKTTGRIRNIHLLFAGAGKLGADLRAACHVKFDAERSSVEAPGATSAPAATFTGFLNQTEISRAYVTADCLVLPSDSGETWGLVVNEAMASGLPCIVSQACGCAEDIVDPQWSFPLGDIAALAERIDALYNLKDTQPVRQLPTLDDVVNAVARAYVDGIDGGTLVDANRNMT